VDYNGRPFCALRRLSDKIGDERQNISALCRQITEELIIKSHRISVILRRERVRPPVDLGGDRHCFFNGGLHSDLYLRRRRCADGNSQFNSPKIFRLRLEGILAGWDITKTETAGAVGLSFASLACRFICEDELRFGDNRLGLVYNDAA